MPRSLSCSICTTLYTLGLILSPKVIYFILKSSKGSFKCYVTLEGVGGYMPKRYEALRGVGGGVTSALRNVIFFANTAWFTVISSRPTRI